MRLNINILRRITPRWVVFLIDLCICFVSIFLAYYFRFNFIIPNREYDTLFVVIITVLVIRAVSFYIGKTYAGMVRHTGAKDILRILIVLFIGSIVLMFLNISYLKFYDRYLIPLSIIAIDFFVTAFTLAFSRLLLKNIFFEFNTNRKDYNNVLIYGTSDLALITKKTIDNDSKSNYRVVGFIDHHNKMRGSKIDGTKVFQLKNLNKTLDEKKVSIVIISEKGVSIARKNYVIETCLNNNVEVKTIPNVIGLINENFSVNQLKNIRIEDLLERAEIKMDKDGMRKNIFDKTVLITGAAGSIGSELVRQITKFFPKKLLLLDIAESPLYEIELEVREELKFNNIEVIIGDVRNEVLIENVFKTFRPDFVYHAAAYKHVPMMEMHPSEAVITNIKGTKIVAEMASKYNSHKFVMVSTDKAVNPTSVMGASKRLAEILVQALSQNSETKFVTTRFGNVLGSNGSVIPRFRKQIEAGGPVTVTDPEMTRYFMTIPEACQLVLEAGNMGKGGEVFIFDMGNPVKILYLAKKMIALSGLKPGKDIQISITGLRPGEKLYEELLANKENTLPTYHTQIMIAKLKEYKAEIVLPEIDELLYKAIHENKFEVVKKMKQIVPEFISKNSIYESLDEKKRD